MSRKLILDLDTGIDDALAIAYALGSPEAELIGITATYGNVLMEDSVRNSLAVLDILGASSVPVHPGLPHSSTTEDFSVQEISAFIHGRNGVGEVDIAPSPRSAEATGAVDFIIEASHRYGDELVYVPTGPLTNLAAALEKDPGLAGRLRVVLMGGALSVSGNVSPWAEANISQDPDAADAVLRSGIDATMIGLDVTLQTLLTPMLLDLTDESTLGAVRSVAAVGMIVASLIIGVFNMKGAHLTYITCFLAAGGVLIFLLGTTTSILAISEICGAINSAVNSRCIPSNSSREKRANGARWNFKKASMSKQPA